MIRMPSSSLPFMYVISNVFLFLPLPILDLPYSPPILPTHTDTHTLLPSSYNHLAPDLGPQINKTTLFLSPVAAHSSLIPQAPRAYGILSLSPRPRDRLSGHTPTPLSRLSNSQASVNGGEMLTWVITENFMEIPRHYRDPLLKIIK